MKKKLVKLILFIFLNKLIFSQEIEKEKSSKNTDYISSYKKNKEILNKSQKIDFENKYKIALELKEINPKVSIQRIYDILMNYKDFLIDKKILEILLNTLYELSLNQKEYDYLSNFYIIINELEKEKIIDKTLKEKYIKKDEDI